MERREHYRVPFDQERSPLHVEIEARPGVRVPAQIADLTRKGIGLRVTREHGLAVAPEQDVKLHFIEGKEPIGIYVHARIRSVVITPNGWRYGLRFDPKDDVASRLPQRFAPRFNRRVARRTKPMHTISVELIREDGYAISGILRNVSWSGMSVAIPAQLGASPFDRSNEVEARFKLPGISRAFRLVGELKRNLMQDAMLCYGIHFAPERTHEYKSQQAALKRYVAQCFVDAKAAQQHESEADEKEPLSGREECGAGSGVRTR